MASNKRNLPQHDGVMSAKGVDLILNNEIHPEPATENGPDNQSAEKNAVVAKKANLRKERGKTNKVSASVTEDISKTSLYIPTTMLKELKYLSIERDQNVNACIIDAITSYLRKVRKSKSDEGIESGSDDAKTL